jgi:hypothetical protein
VVRCSIIIPAIPRRHAARLPIAPCSREDALVRHRGLRPVSGDAVMARAEGAWKREPVRIETRAAAGEALVPQEGVAGC